MSWEQRLSVVQDWFLSKKEIRLPDGQTGFISKQPTAYSGVWGYG
ncbi:hypothetical protein PP175_28965 (plasmid) [Aneurinibacillus sp. Ricciae_BoGa-3]|nr:hypothetical protein [Aneurinibacillus sp. Ricciae_BoGa-3]WCK57223.1 hypothetical protein PP175_28965 [Aneurinibacillus sp. Ricciae_BoGa-3]